MAANNGRGSKAHGCDPEQLEVGQFLSRVSYVRVKEILESSVIVENEFDFSWKIGKPIVAVCIPYASHIINGKYPPQTFIALGSINGQGYDLHLTPR